MSSGTSLINDGLFLTQFFRQSEQVEFSILILMLNGIQGFFRRIDGINYWARFIRVACNPVVTGTQIRYNDVGTYPKTVVSTHYPSSVSEYSALSLLMLFLPRV